jgi:hypothetical protein
MIVRQIAPYDAAPDVQPCEPVSATYESSKRKLENGEPRLTPEKPLARDTCTGLTSRDVWGFPYRALMMQRPHRVAGLAGFELPTQDRGNRYMGSLGYEPAHRGNCEDARLDRRRLASTAQQFQHRWRSPSHPMRRQDGSRCVRRHGARDRLLDAHTERLSSHERDRAASR